VVKRKKLLLLKLLQCQLQLLKLQLLLPLQLLTLLLQLLLPLTLLLQLLLLKKRSNSSKLEKADLMSAFFMS
jgi:hypothetical protein